MNFRWFQLYVAFRNIFKRSNAIFWMYSRIRCLLDNLKYFVLRLYFYIKPQKKGLVRKKRLLKKRCIKMVRKSSSRQIHVFWLGNYHDQDFSGFMQAIKKLFQVSCYYVPGPDATLEDNGRRSSEVSSSSNFSASSMYSSHLSAISGLQCELVIVCLKPISQLLNVCIVGKSSNLSGVLYQSVVGQLCLSVGFLSTKRADGFSFGGVQYPSV